LQPLQSADRLAQSGVAAKIRSIFESSLYVLTWVGDAWRRAGVTERHVLAADKTKFSAEERIAARAPLPGFGSIATKCRCLACNSVTEFSAVRLAQFPLPGQAASVKLNRACLTLPPQLAVAFYNWCVASRSSLWVLMIRIRVFLLRFLPLLIILPIVGGTACNRSDIEAYSVLRPQYRLLGAIVPTEDSVWMIKLLGEESLVEQQREKFLGFVKGLKFPANGTPPIEWKIPDGWQHETGRGLRYASLYIGDQGLVVTVFRFGSEAQGMVVQNVNRWRSQLNLPPISAQQFVALPTETIDTTRGWIIDLRGKTLAEQPVEEPVETPAVEIPTDWVRLPSTGAQRIEGYRIGEAADDVEMTVTRFPGDVGGLTANVNRWRGQVGLPNLQDNEIASNTQTLTVEGKSCVYVDATGSSKRVLGVIYPVDGRTIFFKLIGPSSKVGKQKPAFESYVRAFKLGGR
jgi:hypothetical protein